jgi:hypothetical protein
MRHLVPALPPLLDGLLAILWLDTSGMADSQASEGAGIVYLRL